MCRRKQTSTDTGMMFDSTNKLSRGRGFDVRKPRRMIGSVAKAISILDCFDDQRPEWNLTQLSKKLGIPKSTLLGTISTLEAANYLEKTRNTHNYRLGLRLFELGHVVRSSMAIRQHAIPLMEEIHERTGAIVYLAIPRDG